MLWPLLLLLPSLIYSASSACPEGSFEWKNTCFSFNSELSGFANAEVTCQGLGGHLASIHDGFTNALIGQQAPKHFQKDKMENVSDFWIGASKLMSHGNWTWMDESPLDYTDWAHGEPVSERDGEMGFDCVGVYLKNGFWSAQDCFSLKPFVCAVAKTLLSPTVTPQPVTTAPEATTVTTTLEPTTPEATTTELTTTAESTTTTPVTITTTEEPTTTTPELSSSTTVTPSCEGTCEEGWKFFSGSCSCYGEFNQDGATWHKANHRCQNLGAHLPSIHSVEELNFLDEAFVNPHYHSIWLGLHSTDKGTTWKWSDETESEYHPWRPGHPSPDTEHNCTVLLASEDGGYIFNDDCTRTWPHSVCQKSANKIAAHPASSEEPSTTTTSTEAPTTPTTEASTTTTTEIPTTTEAPKPCDNDWTYQAFTESCYYNPNNDKVTWDKGNQTCQDLGAHLPSIHSVEEEDFLHSFLKLYNKDIHYCSNFWAGMRYSDEKSSWEWSDGSKIDYESKGIRLNENSKGYPCSKAIGKCFEGYVAWLDARLCTDQFMIICKKPANKIVAHPSSEPVTTTSEATTIASTTPESTTISTTSETTTTTPVTPTTTEAPTTLSTEASTTTAPKPCADGWTYHASTKSCYYNPNQNKVTWDKANEMCKDLGANLPSIHSAEEMQFLNDNYGIHYCEAFWSGMKYSDSKSSWEWSDGSKIDYEPKGIPHPSSPGDQKCSLVVDSCVKNSVGWLSTYQCTDKWMTVCKKPANEVMVNHPTTVASTTTTTTTTEAPTTTTTTPKPFKGECPTGWTYYASTKSCYYNVNRDEVTWDKAEEKCKNLGAHLPSIHSAEEMQFLNDIFVIPDCRAVWSGMRYSDSKSTWEWSDGSKMDYQPKGTPHPANSERKCSLISDSCSKGSVGWLEAYHCNAKWITVCKKPAI